MRKRKARRKAIGTRVPILVEAQPIARPLSRYACKPLPGSGIARFRP